MNVKYIIIFLLILFMVVNLVKNKDTFFSYKIDKVDIKEPLFKPLNSTDKIEEDAISSNLIPQLTFYSYESCPVFYKLFMGLSSKEEGNEYDKKDIQIENMEGLNFRNKIVSKFYNIDRTIRIEHPIININRKFIPVTVNENIKDVFLNVLTLVDNEVSTYENYITEKSIYKDNKDTLEEQLQKINKIFTSIMNEIPKEYHKEFLELIKILEEEIEKLDKILNYKLSEVFINLINDGITEANEVIETEFKNEIPCQYDEEGEKKLSDCKIDIKPTKYEKINIDSLINTMVNDSSNLSIIFDDLITLESMDPVKYNTLIDIGFKYILIKINGETDKIPENINDYSLDNDFNLKYEFTKKTKKIENLQTTITDNINILDMDNDKLFLQNPNFIFKLGNKDIQIPYNTSNSNTLNPTEQTQKQVAFGVKTDFTEEDVINFVEYCFTLCCYGVIDIDLLKFTQNHYRVLPCLLCKNNNKDYYYYILPERIRAQAMEEGKEYTRAKCNGCASNIIVFF